MIKRVTGGARTRTLNEGIIGPERPADEFREGRNPWIYTFPVSQTYVPRYGVPLIQFDVIWKRGSIKRLLISYHQTLQFRETHGPIVWVIELSGADDIWFPAVYPYEIRSGWCRHHKCQYTRVPMPFEEFTLHYSSSITIWTPDQRAKGKPVVLDRKPR